MGTEPRGERLRLAVRQDIDGAMLLQVDNQGAVTLPFAEGKIVDPDDLRRWWGRQGGAALQSPERGGTGRHPQLADPQCPSFAAEGKGHPLQPAGEAGRPTGIGDDGWPEAFSKDRPAAPRIVTEKAPDLHQHPHNAVRPRQIGHGPLIAAMDAGGGFGADGTRRHRLRYAGRQPNTVLVSLNRLQTEAWDVG